jgi:hypothetical protein
MEAFFGMEEFSVFTRKDLSRAPESSGILLSFSLGLTLVGC